MTHSLLLARFADGADDAESSAPLRLAVRAMLAGDAADANSAFALAGVPATATGLRRAIRDAFLRDAATLIDAPTGWQRAGALADAVQCFLGWRWGAWQRYTVPPAHATRLELALFFAARHGLAALTQRQIFSIIEANGETASRRAV